MLHTTLNCHFVAQKNFILSNLMYNLENIIVKYCKYNTGCMYPAAKEIKPY